jgi:hypothetical protein
VVTGVLLPRAPMPASLLVGCLVLLSGGGMIYGTVLGALAASTKTDASESSAPAALPQEESGDGPSESTEVAGVGSAGGNAQ